MTPAGASQRPAPTRLSWRDLAGEALAGLSQRPARTVLTMLGTVLGVGSFVAVLGLTATATGQISQAFTVKAATQITLTDTAGSASGTDAARVLSFPADAEARITALNGVVGAGLTWSALGSPTTVASSLRTDATAAQLDVRAVSPGYLAAAGAVVSDGALLTRYAADHALPVAVLGSAAARQLGITATAARPGIVIGGATFTVIGIVSSADRDPTAAGDVYIPAATATTYYGLPHAYAPASMLVHTALGAANQIADEAPLALRPDRPGAISATRPPSADPVQADVLANLDTVFVLLAALSLVVGAVGIANTTLVAVLERTGEIGLRRALGARPRHITGQFLTESAAVGTLGGLIGTALGVAVVVTVALARHWTAILDPALTLPAPLVGTLTGLLAGTYPALRAARISPLAALHH